MKIMQLDGIVIVLQRKAIKNLYIRVLPPTGQVTVSIPKQLSEQTVMEFITAKLPWIRAQKQKFTDIKPLSETRFRTGEIHNLWGEAYKLKLIEGHGKHEIIQIGEELHLYVRDGTCIENKALVMDGFYKTCIQEQLKTLVPLWEARMTVTAPVIHLRRMKTRWGSCRSDGKRICLNSELAKKPLESLEYVLVHEMVHLFEHSHNHRFYALMDRFLPDWRERKKRLNNRLL
ncbi:MAG: SprT family zinc-dependent metalloprotease [Alcaligenaceae bacterium]|nr:SprT family zinc-dependent metalloprotease [Alcaligenaceae bacterium]